MADARITELDTLTPVANNDWVPVVDVSDTTDSPDGTTKKAARSEFKGDTGATGAAGATGATGATGADGASAFVYIAYASDDSGTGFTTTFNAALDYIAILPTDTEIASPAVGDFAGLWKNYKGAPGAQGPQGEQGQAGTGTGDVVGPASSTDNAIARFDSTTGKLIQNSAVLVADTTGVISGTQGVTFSGATSGTTSLVPTAIAGTTTLTLPAATDMLVGKATTDTLTNKTLTTPKFSAYDALATTAGATILELGYFGTPVNYIGIETAEAGNNPNFYAAGTDTNIGFQLTPKGTGRVQIGAAMVLTDSSTDTVTNKTLTSPSISSPTFTSQVGFGAHTAYFTETDNGNSGTADTINWGTSNKQKSTLTGNCTFTFTAPSGPCTLLLKLVQDATGSRTVTWPSTVHWPGGTAPTLTATAAKVDIISFYFDGTTYFGNSSLNYAA